MFNRASSSASASSSSSGSILYAYNQQRQNSSSLVESASIADANIDVAKALSSYRPSDWLHVYYAKQAYKNDGGVLRPDWEVLQIYQNAENGYFGVAYWNKKEKHIIFAHRGTKDFKDWIIDFNTIIHRLNDQQISAWDEFAKKIITEYGSSYAYSFAGHSLGGWLAEVCLWKYQDEFFKEHYPAYQDAFSVTLDDPGGKELLEALQPRVETSYRIAVDKLDRTNYVSRPNLVNTALGREGATVYTLLPVIERSWMMHHTLLFTARMHSSRVLLEEFDQETGLPRESYRVLDWPRIVWGKGLPSTDKQKGLLGCLAYMIEAYRKGEIDRGEYRGFYSYSGVANAPEQLPPASQFELEHHIHYRTTPFDSCSLPLRNMPRAAREFLEELSYYPNRVEILTELIGSPINSELSELLNNYRINDCEEYLLNPPFSARSFRQAILLFLNENPFLYQTPLRILREQYNLKQVKQGTMEAIIKLLSNIEEQIQCSKALVLDLSFNRGAVRLYQFIKPTWDEIKSLENEQRILTKQLSNLQMLELTLGTIALEAAVKTKVGGLLQQHKEELEIAKQSINVLIYYLKDRFNEANHEEIGQLIIKIENLGENSNLDKNLLLNRVYNLQAKIAARKKNLELAREYYQKALDILPNDFITANNYGGLLTDLGRAKKDPALYIEAYQCFQKIWPYTAQIKENEKAVIYSGIAYNYLLLARSLEEGSLKEESIVGMTFKRLRIQARDLLRQAISADPNSVNARLFLAILNYDEKNYSEALQKVDEALILQPQHPTALMRKALILDKLEEPEEALAVLHQSQSMMLATQANASWIKEVEEKIIEIEKKLQKTLNPRF